MDNETDRLQCTLIHHFTTYHVISYKHTKVLLTRNLKSFIIITAVTQFAFIETQLHFLFGGYTKYTKLLTHVKLIHLIWFLFKILGEKKIGMTKLRLLHNFLLKQWNRDSR